MKVKTLLLAFAPFLFLISSCSLDNYEINNKDSVSALEMVSVEDVIPSCKSDAVLEYAYDEVNHQKSLEDRLKYCDVDSDKLSGMTTEALVKSVIDYPLNYLVHFYNDPQEAVSLVIENSALHRELLGREDAADAILKIYERAGINMDYEKSVHQDYESVPYSSMMFFEYFIASDSMMPVFDNRREELRQLVEKKLEERLADNEVFSYVSLDPLVRLSESLGGIMTSSSTGGVFISYVTIYTPLNHQPLEGLNYTEMTATEIANIDAETSSAFSNAQLLYSSSAKYNCHSYAWHSRSTNNNVWLNRNDSNGVFQLQKYWTNDLYSEVPYADGANIVYYSSGDHSGALLTNSMVESKWGRGPVMRHPIGDCPYVPSGKRFFMKLGAPGPGGSVVPETITIYGNSMVLVNSVNEYYLGVSRHGRTYQWTVTDLSNPSSTGTYELTNLGPANTSIFYTLKCKAYGAFKIRVDEYSNGINTARGEMTVISYGS